MADLFTIIEETKIEIPILISVQPPKKDSFFIFCSKFEDEIKVSYHENESRMLCGSSLKGVRYYFKKYGVLLRNGQSDDLLLDINGSLEKNQTLEYLVGSDEILTWLNSKAPGDPNFLKKIYKSLTSDELRNLIIHHYPNGRTNF